ncbi:MAG: hypothetical protein ABSH19_03590, partial [Opitutales bacterium]
CAVSADPVPIKGKNGVILTFNIQQITATSFTGTRKDNGQTVTVAWTHVDLDWLKTNQPDTYKSYTDALAAPPAAADSSTATAAFTPADIAAQLIFAWKSTAADFRSNPISSALTFGTNTRKYRLSINFNPSTSHNHQKGGGGGGTSQNNQAPPPGPDPKQTNISIFKTFNVDSDDAHQAYADFLDNNKLRDAMTNDVNDALAALQPMCKGSTFTDATALVNAGQSFLQAMQDIIASPDTIQRSALDNIQAFLDIWRQMATNGKLPSAPSDN